MIKLLRAALMLTGFLYFQSSFAQWQVVEAPNSSNVFFNQLTFSSANVGYAIGNNGAVYKTADQGQNWQQLNSGTTRNLLGLFFVNDETGFIVGDSALVLSTTDGGATFTPKPVAPAVLGASVALRSVAFQPGSSTIGVFAAENGAIIRTINGGNTFTAANTNAVANTGGYSKVVFASSTLGFAVGDRGTVARTTNGGNIWTRSASLGNIILNDVQFIDDRTGFIAGTGGLLRKTTNGGTSWTAMNSYQSSSINSVYFTNGNLGWAVGSNGRILKTGDGRNFESQNNTGETMYLSSVHFLSTTLGFAVGQGKILRHADFSISVNPTRLICGGNTAKIDTFTLSTPDGIGFFGDNQFKLSLWSSIRFTGNRTLVKDIATINANTSGVFTFRVDTLLKTDTITYYLQATSNSPTFQSTFFPVEVNLSVPNRPIIGNTDSMLCSLVPAYYGFAAAPKIKSYVWNFSPNEAGQIEQIGDSIRFNPNPNYVGSAQLSMNHFNACGVSATSAIKNLDISIEPRISVFGAQVICGDSLRNRYRILDSRPGGVLSWVMNSPNLGTISPVYGSNEATIRWNLPSTVSGNAVFTVVARRKGSCGNYIDTLAYSIIYRPIQNVEPSVSIQVLQDSACPGRPFIVRAVPVNAGNPLLTWFRDGTLVTNNASNNPILPLDPLGLQTNMVTNRDSMNIRLIMNSRLSCASNPIDTAEIVTIYRRDANDPTCLLVNTSTKVVLSPSISYFPNPAENELNLVFSQFTKKDVQVQIFDQMGRDVMHMTTFTAERSAEKMNMKFDIQRLKTGMYLIKAGNAEHQKLLRFIKK